jgi:hypothetical protein
VHSKDDLENDRAARSRGVESLKSPGTGAGGVTFIASLFANGLASKECYQHAIEFGGPRHHW